MGLFDSLGSSGSTSKREPWEPQQQYIKQGFQGASDWLNNANNNPNPNVGTGRQMQEQSALAGFGGAVDNQNQVSNFFSSPEMLDPASNPYLQANIDQLGTNISQQAGRNQNQINQQAVQAGAYGGGRQGVAQGLNAEAATNAFTQGTQTMLMDNYNRRLQQMQAQQQFLPQQAQLDQLPGMVLENLGLSEQNQEMDNLERFWNIIGSTNWGGTSSSTSQASPLQMLNSLGSAASGFSKAGFI